MWCGNCGREIYGNLDPERGLVCGRCCLSAAAYVETHPEEYPSLPKPPKRKIHLSLKKESTERTCPCGNVFEPDSRGQKFCPLCHHAARQIPPGASPGGGALPILGVEQGDGVGKDAK